MAAVEISDEAFLAFLRAHPDVRSRFASIARAVEDCGGDLKEADAAEERLFEEMRLLGREALRGWAETQVARTEQEFVSNLACIAKVKKSPLAHEIRADRGLRAAIQVRDAAGAPVPA